MAGMLRPDRSRFMRNEREKDAFDWSKKPEILLHEILWCIVKCEVQNKKKILEFLNSFIKFCNKFKNENANELGFTDEEILRCLRTSLLHESAEVRAAGIRSIRHFIKNEHHVKCIYDLKLDFLIARSIDICLDNKTERIQALRLIRKLLRVDHKNFSLSLARCLIAISKDSSDKTSKDLILRTCLAILSELIILNPELSYRCDLFSSLMDSICRCTNPYNILESVLGSYIYLINNPDLRIYTDNGSDLQKFIGIFTDLPYVSWLTNNESNSKGMNSQLCAMEEIELRIQFIKNILVSIFRSWPGLIYMCQTTKNDILLRRNPATLQQDQYHNFQIKNVQNLNGVQSLVEMMYLPFEETRKHLMEIIFELFYLPIPDLSNNNNFFRRELSVDDFEIALYSTNLLIMQDNWQLYNGFVAAEAKSLLPHISSDRLNFTDNYISLLLYSLISNGLLGSLISIIISPDNIFNSVRATILLGELVHLTNQYLPPEMSQVCQSLPQLMDACVSDKLTIKQKMIANTAISCLNKMHSLKKKPMTPCSLFLDLLLQFSNPSFRTSFNDLQMNKWKIKNFFYKIKENEENSIVNSIRESSVLLKDYNSWDWSVIGFILKVPSDYMKKVEENPHKQFLRRLINFFKPSSKQFSSIDHNDSNAREISLVGLYLIDFLMECDESKSTEFIDDLMSDINLCLSQISIETAQSANCIFGPGKMLSTSSSSYFLFIGKLSNTNKGRKLLEKSGIYQILINLIDTSTNDVYIKLIISSLDYNQENFSRKLLNQALVCKLDSARLYATNFLRVLLRSEMKDFHKWVIELLVQQLNDENSSVSQCAVEILDEACDKIENLTEIIKLRPNLLHLNDKGILLFSRFASCKDGFNYLQNTNLLNYELERWRKTFCLKYVNIIEEILNETFTYHQKSEDGSYGRRMDKKHFMVKKNAYLPPHLYGQLALCEDGAKLIANESILPDLINQIKKIVSFDIKSSIDMKIHCSELIDYKELTILQLKAALWACSHIASTELGLELIKETDFIKIVVELASNCQLLSIRAIAFYCLGLISITEQGSTLLYEYDWITVRHNRLEKWPIFKEMIEKSEAFSYPFKQLTSREYASSISSLGTYLSAKKSSPSSMQNSRSGLLMNNNLSIRSESDKQLLSKSLSNIENENHRSPLMKLEKLNENFTNGNSTQSINKLSTNSTNQIRPRSSSDCEQKVSFNLNLNDRKSVNENELEDNCPNSTNSTQPSLTEVNSSSKKTISIDQIQYHHHYLENHHSHHLGSSDQGSSDQLTSPVSLGDVEYSHSKLNYDTKNMYLPSSIIDENSTYDLRRNIVNASSHRRPSQYSLSTRKSRPTHLSNSLHSAPKRKTSEPASSMDYKTMHMRMIKHSSATNICHLKQQSQKTAIQNSNTAINNDEDNLQNNKFNYIVHHSTSYPESIRSHSYENSLPTITHHNREAFRKLSQISNPQSHSFERNYSLYINTCLTEHGDSLDNCENLLGLQDDSFEIVMPGIIDTIGYATLKALQHKKEKTNQLLMFNNQFSGLKEGLIQSEEQEKTKLYELNGVNDDNELTKELNNSFKLSSVVGNTDDFRIKSEFYMCICLPDNLSLIFDIESNKNSIRNQQRLNNLQRKILDEKYSVIPKTGVDVNLGFKLHAKSLCLLGNLHKVVTIESNQQDKPKKEKDRRTISVTESNLDEDDRIEIKREIINLVCRLSSCIFNAKTENNLLGLKQKFPNIFQDVCLYSEVCLHISNYSFTLHSRRFLQELFLDVDFEQLYLDAKNIFQSKAVFISSPPIANSNSPL